MSSPGNECSEPQDLDERPVLVRRSTRDLACCKVCGFELDADEGLADRICDSCDADIVQHQHDLELEAADQDLHDLEQDALEAELEMWNRGDAENFWAEGGFGDADEGATT